MTSSFETLPSELFRFILVYLSPEDTAALSQTCRRMYTITCDETIWQNYFLKRYTYSTRLLEYSDQEYLSDVALKSPELPQNCTWQEYFRQRAFQDKHIRFLLNEIITNRTTRISNASLLSSTYGLLALDVLKNYFPPSMNGSSLSIDSRNLTREYYSSEIARLISREIGLHLLNDIKNRREISTTGKSLINGLFIIQCFHPHGIFLSLNRLHSIGQKILNHSTYSTLNLNEKCQLILSVMQSEKFLPANGGNEYYDLENSFLYSTFNGKPTIPLTLVAIFCALANECDLIARPLGCPGEVMAQVSDSSNFTTSLIISVFNSKILTVDEINDHLVGALNEPFVDLLSNTSIIELIMRSARNMLHSITRYSTSSLNSYGLYATVSILKILGGNGAIPYGFDSIMSVLKEEFSMDIHFFNLLSTINPDQQEDNNNRLVSIEIKRRTNSDVPKYYTGQIFQHEQYKYWGIICGWDEKCMASLAWQRQMRITSLVRAGSQPFYHILATDSSKRYVAEDNINILAFISIDDNQEKSSIIQDLCAVDDIGKYFEKFDSVNGKFLANVELRNEYPDDFK